MLRKFDQYLVSLQAALPKDKEIVRIIVACNMSPSPTWKTWQNPNQTTLSYKYQIKIKNSEFVDTTDLYLKASIEMLLDKSSIFLCRDNYLYLFGDQIRCFCFTNGYTRVDPLAYGLGPLRQLIRYRVERQTATRYIGNTVLGTELTKEKICKYLPSPF